MAFLLDGLREDIGDALRREFLKDALNGGLRRKSVVAVVVVDVCSIASLQSMFACIEVR